MELSYLTTEATSKIQLMNAGVIAALKLLYRSFQMDRALDSIIVEARD